MLKFILYGIGCCLVLLCVFYVWQRHLIYYPYRGDITPKRWGVSSVNLIKLYAADGTELNAWYQAANRKDMPILIYFHGNAGHIGYRASIIKPYLRADFGVLLLSYRGYGNSGGRPSEEGFYQDGRAAINYLLSHGVNTHCMVLFGESLGSGVAIQMATEYSVGGLVLQSSFSSLTDVGKVHYPFLPVNLLLRDRYDSYKKIDKLTMPKLFIHGKQDTIVPIRLGYRLYAKAPQVKQMYVYENAGHNNMPDFSRQVIMFIKKYRICQPYKNSD